MIFTETPIAGAWLIDLEKRTDTRGFFARAFCAEEFAARGLDPRVAQMNQAWNERRGTLRGLHWQEAPHGEAKLVRVIAGAVYDVIVDLRPDSPSFRRWYGAELGADSRRMLYAPAGCAHGYLTLADGSELLYQASQPYAPGAERGLRWDDPALAIEWPESVQVISDKDLAWPLLEAVSP